jgi:chloramphenicol 3-O-phosphotransferase
VEEHRPTTVTVAPVKAGRVIVLNGTTSAGKSTLAMVTADPAAEVIVVAVP